MFNKRTFYDSSSGDRRLLQSNRGRDRGKLRSSSGERRLLGLVARRLLVARWRLVPCRLLGLVARRLVGLVAHRLLGLVAPRLLGLVARWLVGLVAQRLLRLLAEERKTVTKQHCSAGSIFGQRGKDTNAGSRDNLK